MEDDLSAAGEVGLGNAFNSRGWNCSLGLGKSHPQDQGELEDVVEG